MTTHRVRLGSALRQARRAARRSGGHSSSGNMGSHPTQFRRHEQRNIPRKFNDFTLMRVYNFLIESESHTDSHGLTRTHGPRSRAMEKLPFPAIFRWRGGGKKGEKKEKKEKKKEKKKGEKRKKEREKKEEKRKRRERKNRRKTLESNSKSLVKTLIVSIRRRNGAPKDKFQLKITH